MHAHTLIHAHTHTHTHTHVCTCTHTCAPPHIHTHMHVHTHTFMHTHTHTHTHAHMFMHMHTDTLWHDWIIKSGRGRRLLPEVGLESLTSWSQVQGLLSYSIWSVTSWASTILAEEVSLKTVKCPFLSAWCACRAYWMGISPEWSVLSWSRMATMTMKQSCKTSEQSLTPPTTHRSTPPPQQTLSCWGKLACCPAPIMDRLTSWHPSGSR